LSSVDFVVQNWGLIEYETALSRQMDLVDLVQSGEVQDTLVFCTHPAVVTLGRGTREGDVFSWKGKVVEVNRGGRATYHGPSQIVIYPIVDLNRSGRDLHKFMRALETAMVNSLAEFAVIANGRTIQMQDPGTNPVEATGVWYGSRKLASIGIGVRRWISFHGCALNIENDVNAFSGMRPCGFNVGTMVSMEEIMGTKPDRKAIEASLKRHLLNELSSL
jgi:lipoyl(octanoyl) transferase